MASWIVNEGPKWLILVIYLVLNAALFGYQMNRYLYGKQFHYLRKLLYTALAFARSSGFVLNFNCLLILLPVCRNLISFLRGACTCCRRSIRRQFDKNLFFHKWVAYVICFWSVVHVVAHCFNGQLYVAAYSSNDPVVSALVNLPRANGTWLNPFTDVTTSHFDSILQVLQTWAGVTGVIITLVLIVMVTSATEIIRRSYFEVFWFTHHLFTIFFIGVLLHGIQGIVRSQSNLATHHIPNRTCSEVPDNWGHMPNCDMPVFVKTPPASWQWLTAPLIIYVIERLVRFYRSQQKIWVKKIVVHPSRVIEVCMKRRGGFHAEVGQYIFLHCPQISALEWHPFTLTSAPEDDHFSVHVRVAGDWTATFMQLLGKPNEPLDALPQLAVDGPFGTASEDVFKYQVALLIATGIGVTPFASVLKSIWHKYRKGNAELKLKKVYFYWMCPETAAFEWFATLLKDLETQMSQENMADFLQINLFLTRWDPAKMRDIINRRGEAMDPITALSSRTRFGRPKWETEFSNVARESVGVRSVGVFFCGPKPLSHTLHKMSNLQSSSDITGVHFHYNKENF